MNILAAIKGEQLKLERQLGKVTAAVGWSEGRSEGIGALDESRSERIQGTCLVGGREKEDF
jgi:hypothetical protein